jgi:RES domain
MSPAGISMFYGSDDKQTTLAEMPALPKYYAIGTFETLGPLRVLDLTKVKYPSIFDDDEKADYDWLLFMSHFLRDFSSPIKRDDDIHIDYVPTQVVTEYRNSVRRPGRGSLTYRNCEGFCRSGNRVGLPGRDGGRCRDHTCCFQMFLSHSLCL